MKTSEFQDLSRPGIFHFKIPGLFQDSRTCGNPVGMRRDTHLDLVDVVDGVVELDGLAAALRGGAGGLGGVGGHGEGGVRLQAGGLGVAVVGWGGRGRLHHGRGRHAGHVGRRLLALALLLKGRATRLVLRTD